VDNVITVGLDSSRDTVVVNINGTITNIPTDDLKRVRIFGDTGNDQITIDDSQSKFSIQTYIFAGDGDDRVRCRNERDYVEGNGGDDRISLAGGRNFGFGDTGADIIDGGGQRDFISGGAGADTISGGGDRDQLQGDNGDDVILGGYTDPTLNDLNEGNDNSNDTSGFISADGSDLIFGGRGNDTLQGDSAKDVIFGQDGDDMIFGNSDRDELFGMAGNDTIDGGSSRDTIWGGDGDDELLGGGGGGETHTGEYSRISKFVRAIVPQVDGTGNQ
jgi:Ca2+-binding RTX toxin-like protein